jgi:class 3 adenylate cyclase
MSRHNRTANTQVVFVDIEKYSKRSSAKQMAVIDAFTVCLREAIEAISRSSIGYAQANDLNFQQDIVVIPTGDGAALGFTFDGLHDMHLSFALALLEAVAQNNRTYDCAKFNEEGWCQCHAAFNLHVGVSDGKAIVYRDVNGDYNLAGSIVNDAARVMAFSERNQIIFTQEAYRHVIDMVDDSELATKFVEYTGVPIKHGENLTIYQFVDPAVTYLNSNPPAELEAMLAMLIAMDKGTRAMNALISQPGQNTADAMQTMANMYNAVAELPRAMSLTPPEPVAELGEELEEQGSTDLCR